MSKRSDVPIIEEKSKEELDAIICMIKESSLPEHIKDFILKCIEGALWFPHILQKKNISLDRLKRMIFGKGYKNKDKPPPVTPDLKNKQDTEVKEDVEAGESVLPISITAVETLGNTKEIEIFVKTATVPTNTKIQNEKKPGHGRMAHTVYESYTEIVLDIEGFKVGDPCPQLCGGTLYTYEPNKPRVLVRIIGQNIAAVNKYIVSQLRCNLCDYLIQAEIPAHIGTEKYDAAFKSWLVIQKYFVAVPFYRQETLQNMLGFPLPDSTQWDLAEQVAGFGYQMFDLLCLIAANGVVIYNDDTYLRIQEIIKEIKSNPDIERKGMFTTGFIAENDGHKIALFFNGSSHSGENMQKLLEKRSTDKSPIIQMCDALSANIAKAVQTILCNCLSHGFRKFDELLNHFPTACVTIMKLLSKVYEHDEETKEMGPNARLLFHQTHSRPVMELLMRYMKALFSEKLVEPNSELGKALNYMIKHWHKLTRFLSVAGAPLCNNVVERALKIAIRARKSSLFYRTRYSAHIGGMLTSIIYTCHLNNVNPHDYLTVLQTQSEKVFHNPQQWLPWNYKATLKESLNAATLANPQEFLPDVGVLVAV